MRFVYRNYKRIIVAIIVMMFVLIPISVYKNFVNSSMKKHGEKVQIKIKAGTSSNEIISKLYNNGLISSEFLSKVYLKLHGMENELKAGVYMFNKDMTPKDIFGILKNHQTDKNYVRFTIPEGYNIKQIGNKLVNTGLIQNIDDFISCVNNDKFNYSFIKELPQNRIYRLEGYLYPATYEFEKGMTIYYITNKMLNRFSEFYQNIEPELRRMNISLDKAIIIGSMIEKEAQVDRDREKISAVIYNRLRVNMKLQIDATLDYAFGFHKTKVYLKDLKIDSPYNTYKYRGLPRGPISNPGAKSVIAAMNPENANYIYYVAKGDGSHYFTKSYKKFLNYKNANK